MRIIRSFPKIIPPDRTYIVDDLERYYNQDYAYDGLQEVVRESSIILLDWDMAIDAPNLRKFIRYCEANPDWPATVAYYKTEDDELHWMHFRKTGTSSGMDLFRPIRENEPDCDQMGTGICYLPRGILNDCQNGDAGSPVLNDGRISRYLRSLENWKPIPVLWDIHVTHLH